MKTDNTSDQPTIDNDALRVSYGTVDILPMRRVQRQHDAPRCCFPRDLTRMFRNLVFLIVHGVVASLIAVVLLVALVFCGLLLPLCGLGVWIFRLLFRCQVVEYCAKCDVALINYVTIDRDPIQVDSSRVVLPLLPSDVRDGSPSERLVTGLDMISAESAMVLVYLTSMKLVLAAAGVCVAAVVIGIPLLLVHALLSQERVLLSSSFTKWEAFCAYTALVLVFFVAVICMDLIVDLSAAATRFFCCERIYALPLPRARATVSTASSTMRPNVVVIRLPPSASGVYTFAGGSVSSSVVGVSSRGS